MVRNEATQSAVILLIKNAVTGDKQILQGPVDWNAVSRIARAAQIVPLVYEGIHPEQELDEQIKKSLFQITCQSRIVRHHQHKARAQIEKAFQENSIDYMALKGAELETLYPHKELRTMGDLDILIRMEQYPRIREIMVQLGFGGETETDHELIWSRKPYVQVELHKYVIPSYNADYYGYFGDGWRLAEAGEMPGQYRMSPENTWIYVFTHFAKHYRDGGIGIRHMTDLWVFQRQYPLLDQTYIHEELEKLQLRRFYENVMQTLRVWFDGGDRTEVTAAITDRVFGSGAYGTKERADAAHALREAKQSKNMRAAKAKSLLRLIFLPAREMRQQYPVLKRWIVLLPVFWVVRWVEALFDKKKRIRRNVGRLQAMKTEVAARYQQELDLVGLDFHFDTPGQG